MRNKCRDVSEQVRLIQVILQPFISKSINQFRLNRSVHAPELESILNKLNPAKTQRLKERLRFILFWVLNVRNISDGLSEKTRSEVEGCLQLGHKMSTINPLFFFPKFINPRYTDDYTGEFIGKIKWNLRELFEDNDEFEEYLFINGGLLIRAILLTDSMIHKFYFYDSLAVYVSGTNGHILRRIAKFCLAKDPARNVSKGMVDHEANFFSESYSKMLEILPEEYYFCTSKQQMLRAKEVMSCETQLDRSYFILKQREHIPQKDSIRRTAQSHVVAIGISGPHLSPYYEWPNGTFLSVREHEQLVASILGKICSAVDFRCKLKYRPHPSSSICIDFESAYGCNDSADLPYPFWFASVDLCFFDAVRSNAFKWALLTDIPIVVMDNKRQTLGPIIDGLWRERCLVLSIEQCDEMCLNTILSQASKQLSECSLKVKNEIRDLFGFLE